MCVHVCTCSCALTCVHMENMGDGMSRRGTLVWRQALEHSPCAQVLPGCGKSLMSHTPGTCPSRTLVMAAVSLPQGPGKEGSEREEL